MRVRPHGSKSSSRASSGRLAPPARSRATPRRMKPRSLYSNREPGRGGEAEGADRPHDLVAARGAGVHRPPPGDPGGVGEQAPQGDTLGAELLQLRQPRRDLLVQREAPAVDERQGDAGADERFGQRGEVEHRVRRHRPGRRDDARRPERLVEHHLATVADDGPPPPARRRRRPRSGRAARTRSTSAPRFLGTAQTLRLLGTAQTRQPEAKVTSRSDAERAGRMRDEALDVGRQDLVAVALVQPHPRRLLEQDPRDLLVDRHPGLGIGLGQTLGEQLVQLRRAQPGDVREVGAGDEVPRVRQVRVRVGVVLRQRRVEVGGEPAVDVDVGLQLHELEIDADLGELGLQVLGEVDVRLALAGDDDRLDREPVRVAAVGEQLAGEVGVGTVAGQPVVRIGRVDALDERSRRHAFAEQRRVDQLLAVDRAGDRLAHLPLLQRAARAVEEEREVAERLGAFEHERLGHLLDHRRVGDHAEVDLARLQGGEQGLIVGDDADADRRRRWARHPSTSS